MVNCEITVGRLWQSPKGLACSGSVRELPKHSASSELRDVRELLEKSYHVPASELALVESMLSP